MSEEHMASRALAQGGQRQAETEAPRPTWTWLPIEERPEFDKQPGRQFVWIEGSRDHSDRTWRRAHWGIARIAGLASDGIDGYRRADIALIAAEGDMSLGSARVTHWAPANAPAPEVLTALRKAAELGRGK